MGYRKTFSVSYPAELLELYKIKVKKIGKTPTQMAREMTQAFVDDRLRIIPGKTIEQYLYQDDIQV